MPRAHRIVLALLCAAHLGAALTPCPPHARGPAGAGVHRHADASAHADGAAGAHPCHELAVSHVLTAPCPCGCTERSGPAPVAARLGLALLASAPATAAPNAFHATAPARAQLPEPPPVCIDHVPWS